MSGYIKRQNLTAQEVIYSNTMADGVRMLISYSSSAPESDSLINRIASTWLVEQVRHDHRPTETFDFLASPATTRAATLQAMHKLAQKTIAEENGFLSLHTSSTYSPAESQEALQLVDEALLRIGTGTGMRSPRMSQRDEQNLLNRLCTTLHWQLLQPAQDNRSYDQRMRDYLCPAKDIRKLILGQALKHEMQDAVTMSLNLALRGENTSGRILSQLGIAMTQEHVNQHEAQNTPAGRILQEIQLAVQVIADDVKSPGGLFNTQAMQTSQLQLAKMAVPPQVITAEEYATALQPALDHANRVHQVIRKMIEHFEPPIRSTSPHSFYVSGPARPQ